MFFHHHHSVDEEEDITGLLAMRPVLLYLDSRLAYSEILDERNSHRKEG